MKESKMVKGMIEAKIIQRRVGRTLRKIGRERGRNLRVRERGKKRERERDRE